MRKLFFFLLLLFQSTAHAAISVTHQALDQTYLTEILSLFPESKEVAPALLDFQVDPNIHLFQGATIQVTYLHEGAGYRNSFGYFLYQDLNDDGAITLEEILKREILFPDIQSSEEGGTLIPGDTVSLGKFPKGTHLGFFLIADGAAQPRDTYYTIDGLNPDGHRHLAMLVAPDGENVVLGIEDLPWDVSDRDFNDILFSFTAEPKSALREIIEEGNIPQAPQDPTPQPTPTPSPPPPSPRPEPAGIIPLNRSPLLEGGGMMCSLSEPGPEPSPGFPWFCLAGTLLGAFKGFRDLTAAAEELD